MCMGMNKCVIMLVMRMDVLVRRVSSMMVMIVAAMFMNMSLTHHLRPPLMGVVKLTYQARHRRLDSRQCMLMKLV